jgi:molybdate transport system substrate-binding protein
MRRAAAALAVFLLASTACSTSSSADDTTTIRVFADSSLSAAFTKIGEDFEAANPGVRVEFNTGSSTDLADQIAGGETADVFASASGLAMDTLTRTPGLIDRTDFATNQLVILTPPDNPADVRSVDSLTRSGVELVMGAEGEPVGDYARQMLANEAIEHAVLTNVVWFGPDDATVVATVVGGEADAGIAYTSDRVAAGSTVASIEIPAHLNVTATYPIAAIAASTNAQLASAFVRLVTGPSGQATLRLAGFGPPPTTA